MIKRHVESSEEKRSDKVLKYHDMGLNNTEIAKLCDCTKENVRQILQRCGLYSPVCYGKNKEQEEEYA